MLEARGSGQQLPLAACYQKIEARGCGDDQKSDFWICCRIARPRYKKPRTPFCLPGMAAGGSRRVPHLLWLDSELCTCCSADPTALFRLAGGKLAGRWAYKGLSISAEMLSSYNPLWPQGEKLSQHQWLMNLSSPGRNELMLFGLLLFFYLLF